MRRTITRCSIALCIALHFALPFDALADKTPLYIPILADNSPALQGKAEAQLAIHQLLYRTWKLKRRRATRHAAIDIVSTVNPQVRWTGSPADVRRNGATVLGAFREIANGCPDLLGALDQIRVNLELRQPQRAEVIIFSSLIHASPCKDQTITLPQPVPEKLDLSFLKRDGVRVTFLWAHPLQKAGWLAAIKKAGLQNLRLLDPAGTKALLQRRGGLYNG